MRTIGTIAITVAGGLLLVLLGGFIVAPRSAASSDVSSAVLSSGSFLSQLFFRAKTDEAFSKLIDENARLKAALFLLEKDPHEGDIAGRPAIHARVFSTYPFNNRGLISVNAGESDGVKIGMAVVSEGGYFLGQVIEAGNRLSIVRTIFDPNWQLPAKAGDDNIDGLIIGGREPRLTMIAKDASIVTPASIFTAGKEFPYGLMIGEVQSIISAGDPNFQEAVLAFPYRLDQVREISILAE